MKTKLERDFNTMHQPVTQAECDHANALREYERIHQLWMHTSVFTPEGARLEHELAEARAKYVAAYKVANPDTIVI